MSSKKTKTKSLSEKFAKSFEPRPLKDPELDSEDETVAKLTYDDDYEDFEFASDKMISDIRKRNVKLLSECNDKYRGKVSSRKELENDEKSSEGNEETDNSKSDDDDLEEYRKRLKNYQIDSDPDEFIGTDEEEVEEKSDETDNSTEQEDSDYDSVSGGNESEHSDIENEENTELLKIKNQEAEVQKGLSVQNQLKIWEKLLEVRIHSQKMLINGNMLPPNEIFNKFCEDNEDFLKLACEAQQNVSGLLEKMMEMQRILLKQYPETKNLLQSSPVKRKLVDNDKEIPTKRFASELNENFVNFRSYGNSVLQKWHDRTKILTPGASAKGNKSHSDNFDIIKKIEGTLFNKNDLIKKSQTVKGNYNLFGQKSKNAEEDADQEESKKNDEESIVSSEIYDDTDFYHQQLRELIEFKTNTLSNPAEMSRQFAELQKLRHKMKKKVDTRASKGRKIRYVVHNKLVNFMAPNDNSSWTEESKNELYRSLFAT